MKKLIVCSLILWFAPQFSLGAYFDYPLLFDWQIDNDIDPAHPEVTPVPFTGGRINPLGQEAINCINQNYSQNRPVSVMLANLLTDEPIPKTLQHSVELWLEAVLTYVPRLDYVFMDLEQSPQDHTNVREVTSRIINIIRNHPDPLINQARIGNYNLPFRYTCLYYGP